jgi:PST family polysaccharide transporter
MESEHSQPVPPGRGRFHGVAANVASLAVINLANTVIPLLSLPYLVHVLQTDRYGAIAFAQAIVQYLIVFVDYGFNLSATRSISILRDDRDALAIEFSATLYAKLALAASGLGLGAALTFLVPTLRAEWPVLAAMTGLVIANALFPIWFFQGIEKMRTLAIVHVSGRVVALLSLFALVHGPDDSVIAAAALAWPPALAGAFGLWWAGRHGAQLRRVGTARIAQSLRSGFGLFTTSIATSLYTNTITVVLGLISGFAAVGDYSIAEKIIRASMQALTPLTQATYPRVASLHARYSLGVAVDAALRAGGLIILAGALISIAVYACSGLAIRLVVGHPQPETLRLLRLMAALPFVVSIGNVAGVQFLFALGQQKLAIAWQILVALLAVPSTMVAVHFFATTGAALAAVAFEALISVGFLLLAWRRFHALLKS